MSGEWMPAETNWREAESQGFNMWPDQREGHAYGGLVIVMGYNRSWEGFDEHYWEIWHHKSNACLVGVHGSQEEAMEMAEDIAGMAEWDLIEEVDWDKSAILDMKLRAYVDAHPEIDTDHHGKDLMGWDDIVPYGADTESEPQLF